MISGKTNTRIKVAITDDHKIFRKGVQVALSLYENIDFVLEADNGANLLDQLQEIHPDVILLDIKMPVMDGIEALLLIKSKYQDIQVIMLTMSNDPAIVWALMEKGANSYLGKDADPQKIYQTILTCFEHQYSTSNLIEAAHIYEMSLKK